MPGLRSVLAAALFLSVMAVGSLATPRCAAACSCIPPGPLATYAEDPTAIVMAGTVTALGPDQRGTFTVERWFHGANPGALVAIQGGNGADCGLFLQLGQRVLVVAYRDEQGIVRPSICAPSADLAMPEGQALVAEAEAAFGPGLTPGGSPTGPGGAPTETAVPFLLILVGGLVVVVIGFAAVAVVRGGGSDRERPGD